MAAELAHFFGALGTEVSIICRGPFLLRAEDEDVSRRFTEVYDRTFDLHLNSFVSKGSKDGDDIALEVAKGGDTFTVRADTLLFATGRVPNTDLLDVQNTGVQIDEFLETNVPGIWALGDIVGKYMLKHSANLEAAYVANNMFNPDDKVPVDYHAMPHAIFSSPQVAGVGVTEEEAKEQELDYTSATYDYFDTAYGSSIDDRDGFVKVLAHPHTREILGCHITGARHLSSYRGRSTPCVHA